MANDPDRMSRPPARSGGQPTSDPAFATDETMAPSGALDALSSAETMAPSSDSMSSLVSAETVAPTSGLGYAETGMSSDGFSGGGSNGGDLAPGERAGEYVVERLIGEGGFGKVFAGVHPVIGKPVAIKVLHLRYSADPDIVSRFVAEARAVNQIGHEGIIDIFAFGSLPDGRQYYVMELLEGRTLRRLIKDRGRLELDETVDLLRQVGGALDAAHAAGVAHRDFKPDNIFLTPRGDRWRVKLLDFGVAKLMSPESNVDHRTATGASVGTPAYMAPEQVVGKNVDHRADIYAFGVVAFHMLTGQLPFAADSAFSIMTAHVNEPPPDPLALVDSLPRGLEQVLGWALAKSPEDRPPSCLAFVDRLAALDQRMGLPTGPQPTVDISVIRDGGGSKAPLALIALVVIALAAAAWFVLGGEPDPPPGDPIAAAGSAQPAAPPVAAPAPPDATVDAAARAAPVDAAVDAALPARVEVRISGLPADAKVLGPDGALLRTGDGPVEIARSEDAVTLTFEAPGFLDATQPVVPDRDRLVGVTMARAPVRRVDKPRPKPRPTTPKPPTGNELPDF